MLNINLNHRDCIESLLPTIELAMEAGEVCQLQNINFLGQFETAVLKLLVKSTHLKDACTGKLYHAQPGFSLIGIDEFGISRTLVH